MWWADFGLAAKVLYILFTRYVQKNQQNWWSKETISTCSTSFWKENQRSTSCYDYFHDLNFPTVWSHPSPAGGPWQEESWPWLGGCHCPPHQGMRQRWQLMVFSAESYLFFLKLCYKHVRTAIAYQFFLSWRPLICRIQGHEKGTVLGSLIFDLSDLSGRPKRSLSSLQNKNMSLKLDFKTRHVEHVVSIMLNFEIPYRGDVAGVAPHVARSHVGRPQAREGRRGREFLCFVCFAWKGNVTCVWSGLFRWCFILQQTWNWWFCVSLSDVFDTSKGLATVVWGFMSKSKFFNCRWEGFVWGAVLISDKPEDCSSSCFSSRKSLFVQECMFGGLRVFLSRPQRQKGRSTAGCFRYAPAVSGSRSPSHYGQQTEHLSWAISLAKWIANRFLVSPWSEVLGRNSSILDIPQHTETCCWGTIINAFLFVIRVGPVHATSCRFSRRIFPGRISGGMKSRGWSWPKQTWRWLGGVNVRMTVGNNRWKIENLKKHRKQDEEFLEKEIQVSTKQQDQTNFDTAVSIRDVL